MRILFLSQSIPWPPDAGPKVKTLQVLQYLKNIGHEVILVAYVRQGEEKHVEALEHICASVRTVPIRRSKTANLYYFLKSQISGRPFLIERDDLHSMRKMVTEILSHGKVDVFHADQLQMAQFAFSSMHPEFGPKSLKKPEKRPFLVYDAHNAVWTVMERMQKLSPWYLKKVVSLEAKRIKRYEGGVVKVFERTIAVTHQDAVSLREAVNSLHGFQEPSPGQISVIPIGIDTSKIGPIERMQGSLNILALGTLHYIPNADGIRWFAQEVLPIILQKVPEACLTIIGKNPPKDFLKMSLRDPKHINVTGYVEDLDPYIQDSAVIVVPVRAGGGMRVRILEAFARGIPAVTTTIGLEGIDALRERDILVEDTPEGFASAVVRLLENPGLQVHLAINGRLLVEDHYDFQVVLQKLTEVYASLESHLP